MGHLLEVRRCFFLLNELPMKVVTCTGGLKDAQCGARQRDDSERGQNVAGADARPCNVASVRECIIPGCSNGNRNPGQSLRVCLVCV